MLNVKIEKSELALALEKELELSWDVIQQFPFDAGFDVRACIDIPFYLAPNSRYTIPTGLYFEMENPYWEIQVRPRSGLAHKNGITIINSPGTVDFAYRDELQIILLNTSLIDFIIEPGDRIAQICFRSVPIVHFEYVSQINKTVRGGLGSTGTK